MGVEMIDLGVGGLKVRKDEIEAAVEEVRREGQHIKGVYAVIASRASYIRKCDIVIDTDDEVLLFGEKAWNEPIFESWTTSKDIYADGAADILVVKIY